jgi:hypothetical protein
MSVASVAKDHHNLQHVIMSEHTGEILYQRVPCANTAINMGSSVNLRLQVDEIGNRSLNDLYLRYKMHNTHASAILAIPIQAIWNIIDYMRILVNGEVAFTLDQKLLKYYFIRWLHEFGNNEKHFLGSMPGQFSDIAATGISDSCALVASGVLTSNWYRSSFTQILGDVFKNRPSTMFHTLELQILFIGSVSAAIDSQYVVLDTGVTLANLQVYDLSLDAEWSLYPNNSTYHDRVYKPLTIWTPHLNRKDFALTPQASQSVSINLSTAGFTPVRSINRIYWFVDASVSANNLANFNIMNNRCVTRFELLRDSQRVVLLDSLSEIMDHMAKHYKKRDITVYDTPKSQSRIGLNSLGCFYEFTKDFFPTDQNTRHLSDVSNHTAKWSVNLVVDLTALSSSLDRLNIIVEANRLTKFPGKNALVSFAL